MRTLHAQRKSVGIIVLFILILEFGCRGWVEKPIETGVETPQQHTLRVTKLDGTTVTFRNFVARNDSIAGFLADAPHSRAAVGRNDVAKTEMRGDTTPHGWRVAGKVYLAVVFAMGLVLAVDEILYADAVRKSSH